MGTSAGGHASYPAVGGTDAEPEEWGVCPAAYTDAMIVSSGLAVFI
ncbi:MAG TPA: hypothetical protein VKT82_09095 [Ktedonobacterales bacterium]|nr:hypothetical protein [Ktedonobacterales bacterium]